MFSRNAIAPCWQNDVEVGVSFLLSVLLFLHLLGMAGLLGAALIQWRAPERLIPLWWWSALLQGATGLAMVGLIDGAKLHDGGPLSTSGHIKVGVKLVVLLIIALLAVVGNNRHDKLKPLAATMGGLTVLNVAIAVFWG